MAILAGIITAVVGAGLSAGLAAASAPDYPDAAKSSRRTVLASLRALPGQRMVEQAARLGQAVDFPTGKIRPKYESKSLPIDDALAEGRITAQQYEQMVRNGRKTYTWREEIPGGGTPETQRADFTGYGDADVQGKLARAMAGIQLELQQKYGTQFIEEALKQQAQADPEGTAARALMAEKINEMEAGRKTRQRPVADLLNTQMGAELDLGRAVDPETAALAQRILERRGGTTLAAGDVTGELESGPMADERLRQRLQKAMGFYGSGASPTDAAYREEQQSMANMANFLGGRTPQSQFASLSGGQQGAAPTPRGPALPNVDPNASQQGQRAGLQHYAAGVRQAANEVSPWFSGLNAIVQGVNAYNLNQRANARR